MSVLHRTAGTGARPTGHNSKSARPAGVGKAAAFYDLDGTLASLNLMHSTAFVLANLGEWSLRIGYLLGLAAKIPRLYFAERQDRKALNVAMFEIFKGVSRDRLAEMGEEYCERILLRRLYPRALEMIDLNRAAGLEPVLVTGSPEFIVAPLARRLQITAFAANRLVFRGGRATGRLHEPVMAGEDKADWCADYAGERGLDLSQCWGYADSHHDLPFLSAMGHPVAVNPDPKLERAARTRQWPILRFEAGARLRGADLLQELIDRFSDGAR